MRPGLPQSAEERASLLEVGQDVTKDVEEQVGVVISEDQSGAEADGLVATAPQHQAWKERHGVGGLGARAQSHLLGVPWGAVTQGCYHPSGLFHPSPSHPSSLPSCSLPLPGVPTLLSSLPPNCECQLCCPKVALLMEKP